MNTFENVLLVWKSLGCNQIYKLLQISADDDLVVAFMNRYSKKVEKTFQHVATRSMVDLDFQIKHPHIPDNNLEFGLKTRRMDLLLTRYFRRMQAAVSPEWLLGKNTLSRESTVYDREEKNINITLE